MSFRESFTVRRLDRHTCPEGKLQAFLWDAAAPGLGMRTTAAGAKSYVFQSELKGKSLRMTIGSRDVWTIPQAQERARELQRLIDQGRDPRQVKAETTAADRAKRRKEETDRVTVAEVWSAYVEERRPFWGERHHRDHIEKAQAGGQRPRRGVPGGKLTVAGPLHPLMTMRLRDLDSETIERWAKKEAAHRPTAARLAWRLLKCFLTWCAEQPAYTDLLPTSNPAKTKKARELLGKASARKDVLLREQLAPWFDAVRQMRGQTASAYVQILLLTGARPSELRHLKWADVDFKWKSLTIRDKVEGARTIPLTPYVDHLLQLLPKVDAWVFSSAGARPAPFAKPSSKQHTIRITGSIAPPQKAHAAACRVAGIDYLTFHGLRRSFASLSEWQEVPTGVVAQIMGHKPSATAEKHYKVRPLDLLRLHHEKIEAWMLEQAGVTLEGARPAGLRLVV